MNSESKQTVMASNQMNSVSNIIFPKPLEDSSSTIILATIGIALESKSTTKNVCSELTSYVIICATLNIKHWKQYMLSDTWIWWTRYFPPPTDGNRAWCLIQWCGMSTLFLWRMCVVLYSPRPHFILFSLSFPLSPVLIPIPDKTIGSGKHINFFYDDIIVKYDAWRHSPVVGIDGNIKEFIKDEARWKDATIANDYTGRNWSSVVWCRRGNRYSI